MKIFFYVLLISMFVTVSLVSCGDSDDKDEKVIPLTEVSVKIKSYLSTHFPAHSMVKAVQDTSKQTYKIYLSGNYELKFTSTYEVYEIEGITKLPDSVIPSKLVEYVKKNYISNVIISWENKGVYQEIELNNGLDLVFNPSGDFMHIDS